MTQTLISDSDFGAFATSRVKAVQLTEDGVILLDQTRLPFAVESVLISTAMEMVDAIQTMVVRGAPAIGVAGAFGMVLSARQNAVTFATNPAEFCDVLTSDALILANARPTAVNLQWAISRMTRVLAAHISDLPSITLQALTVEAQRIHDEDVAMCAAIGRHGAAFVPQGARILTHCNAGALATAGIGTALGVVRTAFQADNTIQVYADETRPRLQGARLTTWELAEDGIPVTWLSDNMSAWLMKQGNVDMVIVGADRIARNGDSANKIGTYLLALAAKAHNIPFYVAAPSSTIDASLATGDEIEIETRADSELFMADGQVLGATQGVNFYNPAFDVTPAELISGIITESGVFRYPYAFEPAS